MRKWYVPLVLLLGGVLWSATSGAAPQPTVGTANLSRGERVTLWLDRVNSPVQCEVKNQTDQFLGCAVVPEGSGALARPARESWYNLQFVTRIDRVVKD
jgi:hypothetical protein